MDKSSREKISKKCLDLVDIFRILCAKVLVTQLCLIFWDSMDCSPPGSSVHGNLQVRILEWVAPAIDKVCKQQLRSITD